MISKRRGGAELLLACLIFTEIGSELALVLTTFSSCIPRGCHCNGTFDEIQ